jgi:predicted branched-subunit amino acid permease
LWLERLSAAFLAAVFVGIVIPSIRGEGSLLRSRAVVVSAYVAIATAPLLLIVLGQRRLGVLRVAGWLLLCLLLVAVIAFP